MNHLPAPPRTRQCPRCAPADGFTLLELLVAIGVFAVMAAMAYGGLISVLDIRAQLQDRFDRTAAYQKAYWLMRDDFQNGLNRPIRDGADSVRFALQYTPLDHEVDFTRGGFPNPLHLPRSTLRRIGYFWDSDKKALVRRTWPVLDRTSTTQAVDTVLLTEVEALHWRFLATTGQWYPRWPTAAALAQALTNPTGAAPNAADVPQNSPVPPAAVELTMETRDWGKLRLLFAYGLPQLAGSNAAANANGVNGLHNVFAQPPGTAAVPTRQPQAAP
ncbi:MAG TPA: type II secretion system minor pseudopilin GspJ [Nevskiaceae bacterium]|nr:type II secretion system minor pseudopilin GspJ [Nevskiaceae bacterium]